MSQREEKLEGVRLQILRRMYREAEPSADFDKLVSSGVTIRTDWYMDYFLDIEEQIRIIDEECQKAGLSLRERETVQDLVLSGPSPSSIKKTDGDNK